MSSILPMRNLQNSHFRPTWLNNFQATYHFSNPLFICNHIAAIAFAVLVLIDPVSFS